MTYRLPQLTGTLLAAALALPAWALDITFAPVADQVYAYVGDLEGRTYDNEALNANIGLVITPTGAVLIDPGATFKTAAEISEAAKKVTSNHPPAKPGAFEM